MKVTVNVDYQPEGALIEVFGVGLVPNGDSIELDEEQTEVYKALTGEDEADIEIVLTSAPVEEEEGTGEPAPEPTDTEGGDE